MYKEDFLLLLGPPIEFQTPEKFSEYIQSLYEIRKTKTAKRPALIKGRMISTATMTRVGVYEITFQGLRCEIQFPKSRVLMQQAVDSILKSVPCSLESLKEFLAKKKFFIST